MLKLPKTVNRVHWNEGMLLSPQHFQHADHYFELQLAHLVRRSCRYFWGINSLSLDEIALASNVVKITAIECIFPDGSVLQFESGSESDQADIYSEPVSLDLSRLDIEPGSEFSVCVAISEYNSKCASDADSELKRYISVNEGLHGDIGDPQNEIDLVTLQPKLRLHVEQNASPNHTGFPIAKFEKTLDATFQRVSFTPPLLSSSATYSDKPVELWGQLSSILASSRSKASQLRSLISERRSEKVFLEQQRSRIIALTRALPILEALLRSEEHPHQIYCKLLEYASDLAALLDDPVAPLFPKYTHNDLNNSFAPVLAFIESTISSIRLDYEILEFAKTEEGNYRCTFPRAARNTTILLAFQLPASADKALVNQWVDSAYICNAADYEELTLVRDIGLERRRVKSFDKFSLIEGENEVLYEVMLPGTATGELLISGADENLTDAQPRSVLCFTEKDD